MQIDKDQLYLEFFAQAVVGLGNTIGVQPIDGFANWLVVPRHTLHASSTNISYWSFQKELRANDRWCVGLQGAHLGFAAEQYWLNFERTRVKQYSLQTVGFVSHSFYCASIIVPALR
jgi:hypothetical protein